MYGTNEKRIREKLLRERDLTLETAVKICQASEMAGQHAKRFAENADGVAASHVGESVDAISVRVKYPTRFKNKDNDMFTCKRCGDEHKPRQYPAYGKTCLKCKGRHHYAKMCLSKARKTGYKVHTVQDTGDSDDLSDDPSDALFIGMVSTEEEVKVQPRDGQIESTENRDKWMAPLVVNGTLIPF